MFGKHFDRKLSRVQNIVSLLKDLILAVTIAITCVIVYFRGDPLKLNALDWVKLVGAAALIVIGPIVVFLVWRLLLGWLNSLLEMVLSLLLPTASVPKGFARWYVVRVFRVPERELGLWWRKHQTTVHRFMTRHPYIHKLTIWFGKQAHAYFRFRTLIDPIMLALLVLIIGVVVFRRVMFVYLPK